MKHIRFITCLLIVLFLTICHNVRAAEYSSNQCRQTVPANFGWKFKLNPSDEPVAVGYDDSSWESVDLPHDFQIHQP